MPVKYFIDTNVLIYRYSSQDDRKRAIAARLLTSGQCVASVQSLNEFSNVIRRKFPAQFPGLAATLEDIRASLPIESLRVEDTLAAVDISQRHGFQYCDSLMLACGVRLGCQVVLSEDMQHGFVLDNRLTIINPFIL